MKTLTLVVAILISISMQVRAAEDLATPESVASLFEEAYKMEQLKRRILYYDPENELALSEGPPVGKPRGLFSKLSDPWPKALLSEQIEGVRNTTSKLQIEYDRVVPHKKTQRPASAPDSFTFEEVAKANSKQPSFIDKLRAERDLTKKVLATSAAIEKRVPSGLSGRVWTDVSGTFKLKADLVGIKDGNVHLKSTDSGNMISVPIAKLSQADQDVIQSIESEGSNSLGGDIRELLGGAPKAFDLTGHAKSKGLKVKLNHPSSWKASEGERPNIVQKFLKELNGGASHGIVIQTLPYPEVAEEDLASIAESDRRRIREWDLTQEEKKKVFNEDFFQLFSMGGSNTITSITKVDGEICGLVEFSTVGERLGVRIQSKTLLLVVPLKGAILMVACTSGGIGIGEDELDKLYDQARPLYVLVLNSIIVTDKWKKS